MKLKTYLTKTLDYNLSDSRAIAIFKWLKEKGLVDEDDYVVLHNGELCGQDAATYCDGSGEWYPSEECTEVNTGRRSTKHWCDDYLNDNAFRCDVSGEWFSSDVFNKIRVEGQTVCEERYSEDLYYWESDEEYHWEPEPEEEDGIPDYHDAPRPWKNGVGKKPLIGCELEIYALTDRSEIAEIAENYGFIAEKDGSLDDEHGIEIIGKPFAFTDYQSEDCKWANFLADVKGKAKGWDAGKGYGLHVSINRAALSDYVTGKMLVFVHSNQSLCEKIAGREANNWQVYKSKKITDGKKSNGEKYEALAIRSKDRLECRIFRSTLKPTSFLRAVEFVSATAEFCHDASALALTEIAFRAWLDKPENAAKYVNLAVFLKIRTVTTKPNKS